VVTKADQDAAADTLRANIKRLRAARKLTQRALGAAAGMDNPDQTISDFMSGRARQLDYAYLKPLARALGCDLEDLFADPEQESEGVNEAVTPADQHRTSNTKLGDVHGIDARLLRSIDRLTADNRSNAAQLSSEVKRLLRTFGLSREQLAQAENFADRTGALQTPDHIKLTGDLPGATQKKPAPKKVSRRHQQQRKASI
jgi:DNA-binding Xre family transcriptional regulator